MAVRLVVARSNQPPIKQSFDGRRKHLTKKEVERLVVTAKTLTRQGERDALMILLAYKHALRVHELVNLRWDQVLFDTNEIFIKRCKGSMSSTHPLATDVKKALTSWRKQCDGPYVFPGPHGPLTERAFFRIIQNVGVEANLGHIHPHMLRHAAGYELINRTDNLRLIQDFMGHVNVNHTTAYTALSARKFASVRNVL